MKVGQLQADMDERNVFQELVKGVKPVPLKQMLP